MWNINNFWNLCDLENGLNNKIKSPLRGQIVMCVCVCPVFSHGPQPVAIPVEKYQKSAAAATKEHKTHSHPHSTPKRTFKKPKHKKTLDFAQAAAATFLTRRTVKDSARKKKCCCCCCFFLFFFSRLFWWRWCVGSKVQTKMFFFKRNESQWRVKCLCGGLDYENGLDAVIICVG